MRKRRMWYFVLVVLSVMLAWPAGAALADAPTVIGQWGGPCRAVTVGSGYIYTSTGPQVYMLLDDYDFMVMNSSGVLPEVVQGLASDGYYVYAADGAAGLLVLDPFYLYPMVVSGCDTPGTAKAVTIAGSYAYVADGEAGLVIIDISLPWSPALVGSYNTSGTAEGVAVSGDTAYVADGEAGLCALNICNPAAPVLLSACPTGGYASHVQISGGYAFVADGDAGVTTVDLVDPEHIAVCGNYDTPGSAKRLQVSGNYVLVADGGSGFQQLLINPGGELTYVDSYDSPGFSGDIAVVEDQVYLADGKNGLQHLNLSFGSISAENRFAASGTAYGLAADWQSPVVALSDYEGDVHYLDLSTPEYPWYMSSYDTGGHAFGVAFDGVGSFYVAGESGLHQLLLSYPPIELGGTCPMSDPALGTAYADGYVYVANGCAGLRIVDPLTMTLLGTCDTPGLASGVAVYGHYAYIADGDAGLQIADISNPAAPVLAGACDTPGTANGVAVYGNLAFVADGSAGLQVIDIANPAAPVAIGNYDTGGAAYGVIAYGYCAFVADGENGIQVVDVSDPASPALYGACDTPGTARAVGVGPWYGLINVADGEGGLLELIANVPPPAITAITPNSGLNDATVSITDLAGSYFDPNCSVRLTKSGQAAIAATNVTVVDSHHITCSFDLNGKTPGQWNVVVVNPDGYSATLTNGFTVVSAHLTLTSIAPPSALNSGSVYIENLAGYGILAGATVKLTRAGESDIAATGVTVVNASRITCYFNLTDKPTGQWNVVVTNPDAETATLTNGFTIDLGPPSIGSLEPLSGVNSAPVTLSLTGHRFQPGATVRLQKPGQDDIVATGVQVPDQWHITCSLDISHRAPGPWDVVVINPDNKSAYILEGFFVQIPSTAPVVAASIQSLYHPIMNIAAGNYYFKVVGKVTPWDENWFLLDDKSPWMYLWVYAPGYSYDWELQWDDCVRVYGMVDPGPWERVLYSDSNWITLLQRAPQL